MNIPALRIEEDIIYDEDSILDEKEPSEKTDEVDPDETNDQENINTKVHALNITSDQEISTSAEANGFENVEELIAQLPDNFPDAVEPIKIDIVPMIADCDAGLRDHYVTLIKKKTNAASKIAVKQIVEDAIKQMNSEVESDDGEAAKKFVDPEIQALAEQIAQDPMLIKQRIDLVNRLGVIGERRNIGLNFLVMDSCLLPMGVAGSEALAIKNSGHYGAGKSFPLFMCLKLYPKSAYHLITSGSDKSLYNIAGGLKHKALILAEALALESSGRGDNELAYGIRSLVSEGGLTYQYTGFKNKEKVTIVKKMEGPTSLLTTTIKGKLEDQLEDRLITMHPNTSTEQTHDIIERTAELASGNLETVDEKFISAWKLFNQSLVPVEVVIPYSKDIAGFVGRNRSLPISVRRAFKRVLSATKTITLIYQKQRRKDEMGRVIAEISDYVLANQLIGESFMESLCEGKRYTDDRIIIIEKHGMMLPKDIAEVAGVSGAAISQWMKPLVQKSILIWCDESGKEFTDLNLLEKAKRSGKAFIKVAGFIRLPTPFELTGDNSWDVDGELFNTYDLEFGNDQVDHEILIDNSDENIASQGESEISTDTIETKKDKSDDEAVKVLIGNTRVKNEIEKIKSRIPDAKDEVVAKELFAEFETILSPDKSEYKTPLLDGIENKVSDLIKLKNNFHVDGILTF